MTNLLLKIAGKCELPKDSLLEKLYNTSKDSSEYFDCLLRDQSAITSLF